jgi:hypothetical protein
LDGIDSLPQVADILEHVFHVIENQGGRQIRTDGGDGKGQGQDAKGFVQPEQLEPLAVVLQRDAAADQEQKGPLPRGGRPFSFLRDVARFPSHVEE